jgi:hypothetical protein
MTATAMTATAASTTAASTTAASTSYWTAAATEPAAGCASDRPMAIGTATAIPPTIAATAADKGAAITIAITVANAGAIAIAIRIAWIADTVGIPGPVAIAVSAQGNGRPDILTIGWFSGDGAPRQEADNGQLPADRPKVSNIHEILLAISEHHANAGLIWLWRLIR